MCVEHYDVMRKFVGREKLWRLMVRAGRSRLSRVLGKEAHVDCKQGGVEAMTERWY
jgi:hypothetical protein